MWGKGLDVTTGCPGACAGRNFRHSGRGRGCRVNVTWGPKEERLLITGVHTVADIYCTTCNTVLGWKYVALLPPPHTQTPHLPPHTHTHKPIRSMAVCASPCADCKGLNCPSQDVMQSSISRLFAGIVLWQVEQQGAHHAGIFRHHARWHTGPTSRAYQQVLPSTNSADRVSGSCVKPLLACRSTPGRRGKSTRRARAS